MRLPSGDSLSDEDVFSGSVMDNITVGRTCTTEEQLIEACRSDGIVRSARYAPAWPAHAIGAARRAIAA